MSCTYGVISDVYYIGVNPSDMADKDTCAPKEANGDCGSALNTTFL